ncbi:MAG: hypothetical protein ACPG4T_01920 [Nannocystaceae bacterium]
MPLNGAPRRKPKFMLDFIRAHPPRNTIGCAPLTSELDGEYLGEERGLYPGRQNVAPASHLEHGLSLTKKIVPRDAEGNPDPEGKVGFMALGLSNTSSEFQVFQHLVSACGTVNASLVLTNAAQPRKSAEVMAVADSNYWRVVERRVKQDKLTPLQVQVVWIKTSLKEPKGPFPSEPKRLAQCLRDTLHIVLSRFPNVQIAYLSSRSYGGYSEIPLSPEPHAYESAFAIKWLIGSQLTGDPELNPFAEKGPVRCPWLSWGPYLWADGVSPRDDGLTYVREDMIWDGVHPSPSGRNKIAALLFGFFALDRTAARWFLSPGIAELQESVVR